MKEFLSRNGRAFVERNVDDDPSAYDDLVARGWRTVPVTVIGERGERGERVINGFDEEQLSAALRDHAP